ncbi:MAG: DUF2306 domain-containing protein [Parerythrobacter sp.]
MAQQREPQVAQESKELIGRTTEDRQARAISVGITVLITVAITAGMTIASAQGGGFASDAAKVAARDSGFLGWPIVVHLATAFPALLLGPVVLWRKKGDAAHRLLGRCWAALMLATAILTAFIRTPGGGIAGTGFSFIHLFTLWTFVSLPYAIWMVRRGNVAAHKSAMTGLYIGLCLAGVFTFIPGRVLGNLVF